MSDLGRDGVGQEGKSTMPPKRSTPKILRRAGELRKELTPAERKLWAHLRLLHENGVHFRRHEVLAFVQGHASGPFITDFCSPRRKLVIELDGSEHLEQEDYDKERTNYLESQGYKVIRFWNNQVMDEVEGVIRAILLEIEPDPHSS